MTESRQHQRGPQLGFKRGGSVGDLGIVQPKLGKAECLNPPPLLLYSDEGQRNPANLKALKTCGNKLTQDAFITPTARITMGLYKVAL